MDLAANKGFSTNHRRKYSSILQTDGASRLFRLLSENLDSAAKAEQHIVAVKDARRRPSINART